MLLLLFGLWVIADRLEPLWTWYVHFFYSDVLTCRHFTAGWFHPFETWAKLSSWFSTRLWTALLFAYHTGMVILICSLDGMFIGFIHPLP